MNFMPLLNQCELEDELSPIDDLSFDISTSFIYFEMNQIVPSKFLIQCFIWCLVTQTPRFLQLLVVFSLQILKFPGFSEKLTKFR